MMRSKDLNSSYQRRELFHRLDDLGPYDTRANLMIEALENQKRPYVVAVIPSRFNQQTASLLRETSFAVVFQHGVTHLNRSKNELKDEFPAEMDRAFVRDELARGQDIMCASLKYPVLGYVPPWNRLSVVALDAVESLGFNMISGSFWRPVIT